MNEANRPKLLKLPEVTARTGLPRPSVYRGMRDGQFPRPVKIGVRSVAWVESEVDAWIESRIRESRKNGAA